MSTLESSYQQKQQLYFGHVRREILPLLPEKSSRVFEVGCGAGDTLSYLKSSGRCDWAGGIELFPAAAQSARENQLDLVLDGNIEATELPFGDNSIDVILCLDVLEHLIEPWSVVNRLQSYLKPGGALICSIPNVRHFRVVLPLLVFGRWRYSDEGILDRTHLRFFTKQSAVDLAESSGMLVDIVLSSGMSSKAAIFNFLTFSMFKSFFECQYLIRAVKTVTI